MDKADIILMLIIIAALSPLVYMAYDDIIKLHKRISAKPYMQLPSAPHKIIAIDFDGVLFRRAWPAFNTASRPILKNIRRALRAQNNGAKLILWTCRTGTELEKAIMMCKAYGLLFDAINANLPERIDEYGNDCRKISADEYWDDKARRV